jgi:hypothetical protein
MTGRPVEVTPYIDKEKAARDAAALAGFKEGLIGAAKGDGLRGVTRGALQLSADSINEIAEAPVRLAFAPALIGSKAITYTTGNDKIENGIRQTRNFANNVFNLPTHMWTGGMKQLANSKLLDPKYLSPEAYEGAVDAGKLGVTLADLALASKMPAEAVNATVYPVLADAATRGAANFEAGVKQEIKERKAQTSNRASIELLDKLHKKPNGPIVDLDSDVKTFAGKPTSVFDIAGIEAAKKDPEAKEVIRQQRIEALKEQIEEDRRLDAIIKSMKQTAGAGIGGLAGLTAAHQITKRIPALKKRKALRYLLNMAAAGGLGYAGWKLAGK